MPSRRQFLTGIGTTLTGGLAGCAADRTTTGIVTFKKISVGVPKTPGPPVDVSLALLNYEPDGRPVTGEYADLVPEVVKDGSISVSKTVHEQLTDRFAFVRYFAGIVPTDGSNPANGYLSRTAFNNLPMGGTATVDPYMKPVDEDSSIGYLRLKSVSPPDPPPEETRVIEYSWEGRVDGI